jgi:quinol monooxygenase YgiN
MSAARETRPDAMASVIVVATLRAAKGRGDALAALLTEQAGVIRKTEPGCLVYRVHRSTQDSDAFLFYEIYSDDAAFDAHRASPHLAQYRKRREDGGMLDGAVDVKVYRAVTE